MGWLVEPVGRRLKSSSAKASTPSGPSSNKTPGHGDGGEAERSRCRPCLLIHPRSFAGWWTFACPAADRGCASGCGVAASVRTRAPALRRRAHRSPAARGGGTGPHRIHTPGIVGIQERHRLPPTRGPRCAPRPTPAPGRRPDHPRTRRQPPGSGSAGRPGVQQKARQPGDQQGPEREPVA